MVNLVTIYCNSKTIQSIFFLQHENVNKGFKKDQMIEILENSDT